MRSRLYLLLGRLLAKPPDDDLLRMIRGLETGSAASPLEDALAGLARAASATDCAAAARAYQPLFIGVGRGELVPYASWYLTGFVGERPLVALRADMAGLGIARADDVREPEDHIAALCEMMSGLIAGTFGEAADRDRQAAFFRAHLATWAARFFRDLEQVAGDGFYPAVGAVGRCFIELESDLLLQSREVR